MLRRRRTTPRSVTREEVTGKGLDDFRELGPLKREAEARSAKLGHLITTWHSRGSHDPYGREAFCTRCSKAVIVTTEPTQGRPNCYGWTLTQPCPKRGTK